MLIMSDAWLKCLDTVRSSGEELSANQSSSFANTTFSKSGEERLLGAEADIGKSAQKKREKKESLALNQSGLIILGPSYINYGVGQLSQPQSRMPWAFFRQRAMLSKF